MSLSDAPINQPTYLDPPKNTKMDPLWVTWFSKLINFINGLVLLPAYPNDATKFLRGDKAWAVPGPTTQVSAAPYPGAVTTRDLGKVYQNTTGKPMSVIVSSRSDAFVGNYFRIYASADASPAELYNINPSSTGANYVTPFEVLPNHYYKVAHDIGTPTLDKWVETY